MQPNIAKYRANNIFRRRMSRQEMGLSENVTQVEIKYRRENGQFTRVGTRRVKNYIYPQLFGS